MNIKDLKPIKICTTKQKALIIHNGDDGGEWCKSLIAEMEGRGVEVNAMHITITDNNPP